MSEKISSKDNHLVKKMTKLMNSPKARAESGLFAAEGIRLCRDAVLSGAGIRCFFYTETAAVRHPAEKAEIEVAAENSFEISEEVCRKIADTQTPQGFFCMIEQGQMRLSDPLRKGCRYAALERIQDPSNLGTILRTAEALGVDGILLSADCCDIYSPKVVRGSMGAVFRLPFMICDDFTAYIRQCGQCGIQTYASTPRDAEDLQQCDFSNGGIMLIGNEGNGLCEETLNVCTHRVRIPMKGRAESLNASAAAAILMFQLMCG